MISSQNSSTSSRTGQYQMFYEENGASVNGEYISAHCAADAKAKFITRRIDRDAPDFDFSGLFKGEK